VDRILGICVSLDIRNAHEQYFILVVYQMLNDKDKIIFANVVNASETRLAKSVRGVAL